MATISEIAGFLENKRILSESAYDDDDQPIRIHTKRGTVIEADHIVDMGPFFYVGIGPMPTGGYVTNGDTKRGKRPITPRVVAHPDFWAPQDGNYRQLFRHILTINRENIERIEH